MRTLRPGGRRRRLPTSTRGTRRAQRALAAKQVELEALRAGAAAEAGLAADALRQAEARAAAAEAAAGELRGAAEDAEAELIGVREESHAALQAADSRRARRPRPGRRLVAASLARVWGWQRR